MRQTIRSPHSRGYAISGERLQAGRKMAQQTHRWMEDNERGFWQIYRFVKGMQRDGGKGRVRDRVAAFCVDQSIRVGDEPYTFNNTWWAGISRYLVLHDPTLHDDPVKFRDSDIDCWGLLPVSYLPNLKPDDGAQEPAPVSR